MRLLQYSIICVNVIGYWRQECFGLRFTQAETQCVTKYAEEMTKYKLVIMEEEVLELIEERNIYTAVKDQYVMTRGGPGT